jgi:anti-sigma factor RsiW
VTELKPLTLGFYRGCVVKTGSNECDIGPLLSAYHDGELSPAKCAEVEAHARECDVCAAELSEYRRYTSVFRDVQMPAAPPHERTIAAVEAILAQPVGRIGFDDDTGAALTGRDDASKDVAGYAGVTTASGFGASSLATSARPSRMLRHARWITGVAAAVCLVATGRIVWMGMEPSKPATGGPGAMPVVYPNGTTQPSGAPAPTPQP